MDNQITELKQYGRRCWSSHAGGEFFGFFLENGVPKALIKVDADDSIRVIDVDSLRLLDL